MDVVLNDQDLIRIERCLNRMLATSGAHCALLIDRSGQLIASSGDPSTLDVVALSALTAANFGATAEIARLLGEEEFSLLFHKGKNENVHFSKIGDEFIMVVLFDDRTTLGLVRLRTEKVVKELQEIFEGGSGLKQRGRENS
ncbi:MAG: roadblock/LC7 domain-containing protein [Deltaproteobacteria bacterium]|nr:MAG: roadblock/LC7 domain-containing protein [Deltaproteobacteria bacterium]